jgi:hypothetical protein
MGILSGPAAYEGYSHRNYICAINKLQYGSLVDSVHPWVAAFIAHSIGSATVTGNGYIFRN